jgi:aspartokinase
MVEGAVSYHRPENVRRFSVEKNNPIVKALEKTREERYPNLAQEQQDRLREIQMQKKQEQQRLEKEKEIQRLQQLREKEERSYDRIMNAGNMTSVSDMKASADATAAEEYEDDFF